MAKITKDKKVQFTCSPVGCKPFTVKGIVEAVKESTFGSCRKGLGATVLVSGKKYAEVYGKKRAFVAVERLTIVA